MDAPCPHQNLDKEVEEDGEHCQPAGDAWLSTPVEDVSLTGTLYEAPLTINSHAPSLCDTMTVMPVRMRSIFTAARGSASTRKGTLASSDNFVTLSCLPFTCNQSPSRPNFAIT